MRKISIEDDLRIGFPGRDNSFHDGIEIGMLATLMALGFTEFTRTLSGCNLEQARALGRGLGYHLTSIHNREGEAVRLTFRDRKQRAKLRVV